MHKNIPVIYKLLLVVLVMLIPFGYVLSNSQSSYKSAAITPWEWEQKGLKVLDPLYDYYVVAVQKRAFATSPSERDKYGRELTTLEPKVTAPATKFNDPLRSKAVWESAMAATKANDEAGMVEAIKKIRKVSDDVGNYSTLILDPDLDSYWVMNALVVNLPTHIEHLGEIVAKANAAGGGRLSPEQRQELLFVVAALQFDLDSLDYSLATASVENPALTGKFEGLPEVLSRSKKIVEAGKEVAKTGDGGSSVASDSNALLETMPKLYHSTSAVLNRLIEGRLTGNPEKTSTRPNGHAGNKNIQSGNFRVAFLGALAAMAFAAFMAWDLTASLKRAVEALTALGNRDLRQNEDITESRGDEFGTLFSNIETVRTSLKAQIASILVASRETDAAVAQMLSVTSQVSAAATETATSLAEASTTADEVKQTAISAEQKAKNVAQSASEAATVAMQGRQGADKTQEDVAEIRSKMEVIAESILQLSAHGRAIGEIIVSVNDLAEQSNVLAVNASIEAAKAGEAGRGFAVVAQEVKSLADESKKSTLKVRSILSDIEKSAASAIMVAEQGTKVAAAGLQQASDAGESIRALGGKVVQAAQAAAQIAASAGQQLAGVDQVVGALVGIRDGSVQVVGALETLERAAKKLKSDSEGLLATASGFQL